MRKILSALLTAVITFTFVSCIALEDIRPNRDVSTEESKTVSEQSSYSEPSSEHSSETESRSSGEISVVISGDITEESSEESSESPEEPSETVYEFEYGGFTVKGFTEEETVSLLDKLYGYISATGHNVSIYYEDLDTGRMFSYDADIVYHAGSVMKAVYGMYLYKYGADMSEELELTEKLVTEGSTELEKGKSYTVEKLIELSITKSDNTAYHMLYNRFGFEEFNTYTASLGADTGCNTSRSLEYLGFMSANESAALFKEIYKESLSSEGGKKILKHLGNCTYKYLLCSGITDHTVAHKYGYMSGTYKVLHDVGIVLDDHPYIISIMSDIPPANGNGRSTFKNIASDINAFHDSISH